MIFHSLSPYQARLIREQRRLAEIDLTRLVAKLGTDYYGEDNGSPLPVLVAQEQRELARHIAGMSAELLRSLCSFGMPRYRSLSDYQRVLLYLQKMAVGYAESQWQLATNGLNLGPFDEAGDGDVSANQFLVDCCLGLMQPILDSAEKDILGQFSSRRPHEIMGAFKRSFGKSMKQIAIESGITRSTLFQIQRGEQSVNWDNYSKLCKYLKKQGFSCTEAELSPLSDTPTL